MLAVIRKNQQVLMFLIAILTIIAFIWLYNPTDKFHKFGSNDVVSVYGRTIQRAEIDREVRAYSLSLGLGLTDFVQNLGGMGANEESSLSDFIMNLFIVRHEAPLLGVQPTDDQVAGVIKGISLFQTSGAFDPAKYATFLQEQLAPRGFTERQLEEIVRDSLRVSALRQIITSPVAVGEGQIREAARIYQPVTAQILRFDRDAFTKDAAVTSQEVAAFYEKNRQGLVSRETRDVSYVVIGLPAAQQKLEGKERASALQKLADQVEQTGKAIRAEIQKGADFAKAAGKSSLQPKKASAIERDGSQNGKDSGVPAAVAAAAFRLQKSGELSDIIQDGNDFYIVTVQGITPAHLLELTAVSDRITKLLKEEKSTKALADSAEKAVEKIRAAMAAGKSFSEAVKEAGVKTQQIAGITPSATTASQEQKGLASATLGLKEGEIGPLQPAPWGAFAAYLEKRAPLTDAQWKDHRAALTKTLLANEQELIFQEWLRAARGAAQIKMLGRPGA